jgi:hypothetical protein
MLVINMAANVPVLLTCGRLLQFHIYLKMAGLSTFQYILKEREEASQQKHKSKVILSKKDIEQTNDLKVENFQYSSRKHSDEDPDKLQKLDKETSDINLINQNNSPPNTHVSNFYFMILHRVRPLM